MNVVEQLKQAFQKHQGKIRAYRERIEEERREEEAITEVSVSPSNAMPSDRLIRPVGVSGAKPSR
jgi:hypothetical protein